MGWELRRGEYYYYRKIRESGHVRSKYFGRGDRAEAAALEDGCPRPAVNIHGEDGTPHASRDTPCVSVGIVSPPVRVDWRPSVKEIRERYRKMGHF